MAEWLAGVEKMKKTAFIVIGIVIVLLVSFFFVVIGTGGERVSGKEITVYKSPSCGCCVGYIGELKRNGFSVSVVSTENMQAIKAQHGIPAGMGSCHTSVVDGYFVEGHVPIEAVNKLLNERPDIDGISLPNMPAGSPGMPGIKRGDFVISALKDGHWDEFMRI